LNQLSEPENPDKP